MIRDHGILTGAKAEKIYPNKQPQLILSLFMHSSLQIIFLYIDFPG